MKYFVSQYRFQKNLLRNLLTLLLLGSAAAGVQGQTSTSEPLPARVPAAVAIPRPSEGELTVVRRSFDHYMAKADNATRELLQKYPGLLEVRPPATNTAAVPAPLVSWQREKHENNLAVARQGDAEVLFMGDSITDFWRNTEGDFAGKAVQDKYFGHWKVANFGIIGDTTQGVLYRLKNGECQSFKPRAVMLLIGTNNTFRNSAAEIAEGIGAVVLQLQECFPDAPILLLGIFPRNDPGDPVRDTIAETNRIIQRLDDGRKVFYLDIGDRFLDAQGKIPADVMGGALHPGPKGYEIWAQAVIEPLTALMAGRAPAGR